MKKRTITYGLLLLSVLAVLALGSGCRTHVGMGFGFGHKKNSIKLKISSALPSDKADIWVMQERTLLSEVGQQSTFSFPKG